MHYSLSDLVIYPIKSVQGISLKASQVDFSGLWGDRRYMMVKPNGLFITGREHPNITLISAELTGENQWTLSHPDMPESIIISPDIFSGQYKSVTVWDDVLQGQTTSENINDWFSEVVGEPVQLVHFGGASERFTSRRPDVPVAFADGYPFLLTSEASLEELNRSCPKDIDMMQFRPNLVVKGNYPFEEDSWKRIRIGQVEFENVKPCVRCIFTTLNPKTAERIGKGEPLKTLGKFRLLGKDGVTFGVNMIAMNTGSIQLDDSIEVLEYREPEKYVDRRKA
ncbi:MAG: MOSC domain-containing protein [Marinomonas foliarum]|uniref:MOSC domain-containing protein n=1 Tax=Marinomonas foliarum TaxID=491950 RepID=UPI003F9DE71C